MHKATLFIKEKKGVKCTACNHYCLIPEGKRGICGVRQNTKGILELLVYGKTSGYHVDPIEKKPLYHFLPGSEVFSFGTIGCNFGCGFCQNWQISQASKKGELKEYGYELEPADIIDFCVKNKIPSIAYTYNEPTVFTEYALDVMKLAKKKGIKNVWVTNGYESEECVELIAPYLDSANIDLKAFREEFYLKSCKAKLAPVLKTIKLMHSKGIWIEITTLLIPGENDTDKEIKQIAEFIKSISSEIPWHISGFHPDFEMMHKPSTDVVDLMRAHDIGKRVGVKYVYVGNTMTDFANTYCPKCSRLLISRFGYTSSTPIWRCLCGETVKGIWK